MKTSKLAPLARSHAVAKITLSAGTTSLTTKALLAWQKSGAPTLCIAASVERASTGSKVVPAWTVEDAPGCGPTWTRETSVGLPSLLVWQISIAPDSPAGDALAIGESREGVRAEPAESWQRPDVAELRLRRSRKDLRLPSDAFERLLDLECVLSATRDRAGTRFDCGKLEPRESDRSLPDAVVPVIRRSCYA